MSDDDFYSEDIFQRQMEDEQRHKDFMHDQFQNAHREALQDQARLDNLINEMNKIQGNPGVPQPHIEETQTTAGDAIKTLCEEDFLNLAEDGNEVNTYTSMDELTAAQGLDEASDYDDENVAIELDSDQKKDQEMLEDSISDDWLAADTNATDNDCDSDTQQVFNAESSEQVKNEDSIYEQQTSEEIIAAISDDYLQNEQNDLEQKIALDNADIEEIQQQNDETLDGQTQKLDQEQQSDDDADALDAQTQLLNQEQTEQQQQDQDAAAEQIYDKAQKRDDVQTQKTDQEDQYPGDIEQQVDRVFEKIERGDGSLEQGALLGDLMHHQDRKTAMEQLRNQLDLHLPSRPG
ncbi:MAG: hypothetical protein JKY93_00435, partial [Gammaproteobacteria bacterium]|nr:hypothetical protein [Gammaproteobacteria bacterium]